MAGRSTSFRPLATWTAPVSTTGLARGSSTGEPGSPASTRISADVAHPTDRAGTRTWGRRPGSSTPSAWEARAAGAATGSSAATPISTATAGPSALATTRRLRVLSTTGFRRDAGSAATYPYSAAAPGRTLTAWRSSTTSRACAASSRDSRTIAVVGLSANWYRPSYFAAKYMQDHGYRIDPGQPDLRAKCSASAATRTSRRFPDRVDHRRLLPQPGRDRRRSRARPSPWARRCCGCSSASATTRPRESRSDAGLDVVHGPLREDRARAHPGRAQLGRRQHRRDLGAAARRERLTMAADARSQVRLRHAVPARRPDSRRGDRRARAADLPDDVVRVRQRRPRGEPLQPADLRQRLFAHLQSDRRRARGTRRRARRRTRRARRRHRHGGADGRRCSRSPQHGDHIVAARTLYGGTYSQLAVTFAQFGIDDDLRRRRRSRRTSARAMRPNTKAIYAETIGNPQLNVLDIAAVADDRARRRRAARHRQHARLAVPVPAVRARRRHRHPLGDQVPRRPRHDDGRRRRRVRQVPLGQRQVSADDRAFARLSRRASSTRPSATSASR